MPVDVLILGKTKKSLEIGDAIAKKNHPCSWGRKEGLPNFIKVTISDAEEKDVNYLVQTWNDECECVEYIDKYTLEKTGDYKIRPKFESLLNSVPLTIEKNAEISALIDSTLGTKTSLASDIIISGTIKDRVDRMLADIKKRHRHRRYCFSPVEIDRIVKDGKEPTMTLKEFEEKIIDRMQ